MLRTYVFSFWSPLIARARDVCWLCCFEYGCGWCETLLLLLLLLLCRCTLFALPSVGEPGDILPARAFRDWSIFMRALRGYRASVCLDQNTHDAITFTLVHREAKFTSRSKPHFHWHKIFFFVSPIPIQRFLILPRSIIIENSGFTRHDELFLFLRKNFFFL